MNAIGLIAMQRYEKTSVCENGFTSFWKPGKGRNRVGRLALSA